MSRVVAALALLGCLANCTPPAPARDIATSSDLDAARDKRVRFRGRALDSLPSARVERDGFGIYCLNYDKWPAELREQELVVEGKLELTDEFVSQDPRVRSMSTLYVIRDCTVERAR
ncbi:MAG: hypothetical protein U0271_25610 [Polyangiaceae bacterium]